MRKLVPIRGSVVCEKASGGTSTETKGFVHKKEEVDVYRILALPEVLLDEGCEFKVGDLVMSNSTGDVIEINPGETVYMFRIENLMCKVEENEEAV